MRGIAGGRFAIVMVLAGVLVPTGPFAQPAGGDTSWRCLAHAPPGAAARAFAPGIVSSGPFDRDIAVMPDGRELFWRVASSAGRYSTIGCSRYSDERRSAHGDIHWMVGFIERLRPAPGGGR